MAGEKEALTAGGEAGAGAASGTGEQPPAGGGPPGDQRVRELELCLAEQQQKREAMEQSLKEIGGELEKARGELGQAGVRYRELLYAVHPDVPAELITGATIPEMDASVEKATALVEKIKASLIRQSKLSIPAGAPARSSPDWSNLTPRDKIKAGIRQK